MRLTALLLLLSLLIFPVASLEIEAPLVPAKAEEWMPKDTSTFSGGFQFLLEKAVSQLRPDLKEASQVILGVVAAVLIVALVSFFPGTSAKTAEMAGTVTVSSVLLGSTGSMVNLATHTVMEIGNYGMLLLPVMTSALAANGGVSTSAALYAGTALFVAVLQRIMQNFFVPGVYLYLLVTMGGCLTGENLLKKIGDLAKGMLVWILKIMLMIFTTYLSLTGILGATTDKTAIKAARVSIATFVPVVGTVLSDASEAVLAGAALIKNTAGIYGIFAVLAIFLGPFLKLASHYMMLKVTSALCAVFGNQKITGVINAFGSAMGMLMGMTASSCVMVLISTVCYMKGIL